MKKLPVLLVSGWAHGTEAMQPVARAMGKSHPVTSLSLAGAGVRGSEQKEVSSYARAISSRLDESGGPVCIVGWSTGGIAAIEAAANYPGKVAGLVLLSATAKFCSENGYTSGVKPAVLRAMIRGLKRNPEAVVADFIAQALYPVCISADELARRTKTGLEQGTDSLICGIEYLANIDLRGALGAIEVPCLIIHGGQDMIVPWQAALHLDSNLPVSTVEFRPSAGHSLIERCGRELIHRIAQFVKSLE